MRLFIIQLYRCKRVDLDEFRKRCQSSPKFVGAEEYILLLFLFSLEIYSIPSIPEMQPP